jgi:hypothetical protein
LGEKHPTAHDKFDLISKLRYDSMQCPNCKHWNEAGARFCEECGFELAGVSADANVSVSIRPDSSAPSAPPALHEVPPPPPQTLVPPDDSAAAAAIPYTGARLILDATGSIFKLADAAVIGREDATLQIDLDGYPEGKYVSHRHAQIVKINGKYYIEDLGSSNHTYVNDIRLSEGQSEPLEPGDKIRFGKIEVTYQEG